MQPSSQSRTPSSRALCVVALAAVLGLVSTSSEMAAAPALAVTSIQSTRVADLVVLGRGFDAGLREGMVCRVTRDGLEIAEVQLVGLRPDSAAALILSLAPAQAIRAGDCVTVKTLKI